MLHAVIMAGGSGTRFWPASRRQLPKQFLKFAGENTLIQDAVGRCAPAIDASNIWVVTNASHAAETTRQLPTLAKAHVLLEPCGRNTAPCIGLAAIQLLAVDPEAVMLVMPADHVIQSAVKFQQAVDQAVDLVTRKPESLVLFGVEPTYPATGFGYIHRGEQLPESTCPMYHVQSFQEKPNELTAARYSACGEYYWNCGIFVWRADRILKSLEEFDPDIYQHLVALQAAIGSAEWESVLAKEFPEMPSISIDYAVLEKASEVCVLEAPFDWDDVGSWHALARLNEVDGDGNMLEGLVCSADTSNCIIRTTEDHLVATIGIKDLIVVHTPTATLIADRRDEGSIKQLIAELERRNLREFL